MPTVLNIGQSGGSSVELTGNVNDLNLESSGGGRLKGYGLIAEVARINSSGGSDAELTVNKQISVESSGGGMLLIKALLLCIG